MSSKLNRHSHSHAGCTPGTPSFCSGISLVDVSRATRPRTARSPNAPRILPGAVIRRRRRDRRNRRAAPGTPPPRTAPVAAARRPPRPLSPRGTRRRPPRSRTARGRDRARANDVQASSEQRSRPRSAPTCRSAPPERSYPATPRTGTASHIMHISPVHDVTGSVLQPARRRRHIERIVQRVDQLRVRVAFGQLDQLPQDASHDESQRDRGFVLRVRSALNGGRIGGAGASMSARASTSPPQSGHAAGSGRRTSTANCV